MAIELLKKLDPKKVEAWDRIHDKRKLYRCERCGAEWKCEYHENILGKSHEMNGDPDILCQCCGFPTVKEVVLREIPEIMDNDENCTTCIHCNLLFDPPVCRINGESLPNPTGRFCNKYDTETDTEAMDMRMREVDNALKLADVFPNPFSSEACAGPSDAVKYFCCGINAHLFTDMYCYNTKGSLWFEDKKAGKLEVLNDSVTEFHVVRLVFELETEFNWLWDRKLGDFNFKIEFNKESDEIQLRLWRKE